jgi:hypothetical protein
MKKVFVIVSALEELVASQAGKEHLLDGFPRDIENLLLYAFEIPVIPIANLTLHQAERYLCALRGDELLLHRGPDRPLLGLLHVGPPVNLIFIREGLLFHIANYVLAHELAHFMSDVFLVQDLWSRTLPEQVEAIRSAFNWQNLDPLLELQAAVKGLPDRPRAIVARGKSTMRETSEREIQADLVAREILAPWEQAIILYRQGDQQQVVPLYREKFSLPLRIAFYYHRDIRYCLTPPPDTVDRLFGPLLELPNNK